MNKRVSRAGRKLEAQLTIQAMANFARRHDLVPAFTLRQIAKYMKMTPSSHLTGILDELLKEKKLSFVQQMSNRSIRGYVLYWTTPDNHRDAIERITPEQLL